MCEVSQYTGTEAKVGTGKIKVEKVTTHQFDMIFEQIEELKEGLRPVFIGGEFQAEPRSVMSETSPVVATLGDVIRELQMINEQIEL